MLGAARSLESIRPLEEDVRVIGIGQSRLDAGSLEETHKFRRTPKKTKTVKTTAGQRRKWKLAKRRPRSRSLASKRGRRPLVKRRAKMLTRFKSHRTIHKRPPGRGGRIIYRMYQGMDQRVNNLVEEVADLVGSLGEASQTEIIKAYANSAVIAEMLGARFLSMAQAIAENFESEEDKQIAVELTDLSEQFDGIAADAAESAEVLFQMSEEGTLAEGLDHEALEEDFQEVMKAVLNGLEIYTDLTEDEDDLPEAYDPLGKMSASKRTAGKGSHGPDSTKQMGTPKRGNFPPHPAPKYQYSAMGGTSKMSGNPGY